MKPLIVANWKMNPSSLAEARKLFNEIRKTNAVICPPFVYISAFKYIQLGAQDCCWKEEGAYTGAISPQMLKGLGVKYVIIGHSERRIHFKETDGMINKKLKAALNSVLIPILCIGEKKDENPETVISRQLKEDLDGIAEKDLKKIIVAYEPVWAIGTGDFCEKDEAKKARNFIRKKIGNKVLYGGSVNSKIAKDYIDVGYDGLLVGGASLNAEEFIKIVKNAQT
ncbi:MAG: triose-phosphate isomerase [Candidatus Portnoybacteria bacterium RBG_13_40_8]|uniref:Triosephosphate isomerase n=1 Tax=Candidatus Portnoybacteria bacterium RBG_13_40_8 TaxID=1801990 RepID=A0A1G2F5L0_9BACT|nr:MAG: triose-phosphate isomerase [Candidatus Portnoybacteria bacterium RBG_13_40_8]